MKKTSFKRVTSFLLVLALLFTTAVFNGIIADAADSKAASVTFGDLKFIVPETIYLYPDGLSWKQDVATPFQYYINNSNTGAVLTDGSAKSTTGKIYFSYSTASNTSLSWRFLKNDMNSAFTSGGSITVSASSNLGTSKEINITAGTSPSLSTSETGCYIEWILSFKDTKDNKDKKAYAYTYVYKPYTIPVGGFNRVQNSDGGSHYAQSLSYVVGMHGINTNGVTYHDDGGYYPKYTTDRGLACFASESSTAYVGGTAVTGTYAAMATSDWTGSTTGAARWYSCFAGTGTGTVHFQTTCNNTGANGWGQTSNDSSKTYDVKSFDYWSRKHNVYNVLSVLHPGPQGLITIDTSRYTDLQYIPNLAIGLLATDDQGSKWDFWYVSDYSGGSSDYITTGSYQDSGPRGNFYNAKNYVIAGQGTDGATDSHDYADEGLKYAGPWPRTLLGNKNTQGATYTHVMHGFFGTEEDSTGTNDWAFNHCFIDLVTTYYNKANLRAAVQNAIKAMPALGVNGTSTGIGKPTSCYFHANADCKWSDFQLAFQKAVRVLGSVDMKTGISDNPNTLATNLNNALAALKTSVYFNYNYGSYNTNLYTPVYSGQVSSNGLTLTYDAATSAYTLNGTQTASTGILVNAPFYPDAGTYTVSVELVSGSKTAGNGCVVLDFINSSGGNVGNSSNTSRSNTDFNGSTTKTFTFSAAQASSIAAIKLWVWHNSTSNVFNNFKFKVKLEKASSKTGHTPNARLVTVGSSQKTTVTSFPESPTRTGYTFSGWSTDQNATEGSTSSVEVGYNQTLYAIWTINKWYLDVNGYLYTVAKDSGANDGGLGSKAKATVKINGSTHASGNAVNDFYSQINYGSSYSIDVVPIAGWKMAGINSVTSGVSYSTDSNTDSKLTVSGTIPDKAVSFRFAMRPKVIKLTLNNQSATSAGTGAVYYKYQQSAAQDTSSTSSTGTYFTNGSNSNNTVTGVITSITKPTRTGYTFGGYYTETNGGGTQYINADGGFVNNAYSTFTADTTLYAKWTINQYTATFKDENGTTVLGTSTVNYGTKPTVPSDPTKAYDSSKHYAFAGWNNGSNTYTAANIPAMGASNVTYTATYTGTAHSFGSWSTNTATCTAGGSHYRDCTVCSYRQTESTNSLGHSYTAATVKDAARKSAATCTAAAVYYYSCSRCGAVENNANHTFTNGDPLGHDYTGAYQNVSDGKHNRKCTRCNTYGLNGTVNATENCSGGTANCVDKAVCSKCNTAYGNVNASNHKTTENRAAVAPTCTAVGYTAGVYCTACNKWVSGHTEVAANGHSESSAWTTDSSQHWKVCTVCNAITTAKANHSYGSWSTNTATCTAGGSHYRDCTVCSYRQTESTNSLGHSYTAATVKDAARKSAATCTAAAVYYYSCSRCGAVENNANHTFTNGDPLGHDFTGAYHNVSSGTHNRKCTRCSAYGLNGTVNATENCSGGSATCTAAAVCSKCNTAYGSANGHSESSSWSTDDSQHWKVCTVCNAITTAKSNHTYGNWSNNNATTHKHTCSVCGYTATANHTWDSGSVTTQPTCTNEGVKTYTCTTANCGATKTESVAINSSAHNYGTPTYTWSADGKTCTATRVCSRSASHKETESATITSSVKTAATCTEMGTTTYTATFTNSAFATQTKDVQDIAALGHDFTSKTATSTYQKTPANCVDKAVYYYKCSRCTEKGTGTFTSGSVNANNHKTTEDRAAVAATCTTVGYTAGVYCTACNNWASGHAQVSALGHSYDYDSAVFNWSGYTCATATATCSRDSSHKDSKATTVTSATTPASTTAAGKTVYTATFTVGSKTYTDTKTETLAQLTVKVTIRSEGSDDTVDNGYYTRTKTLTAPAARDGYTFTGWTVESGNGSVNGSTFTYGSTDTVVSAVWRAHTCTVKFDKGIGTGSMSDQTFTYGEAAKALTANGFTAPSYTVSFNSNGGTTSNSQTATGSFKNWSGSNNVTYTNKEELQNITPDDGAEITLTAQWNYGTVNLPTPTKDNYVIEGWYSDSGLTANTKVGNAGAAYTPTASGTLYAKWESIHAADSEVNGAYATSTTITTAKPLFEAKLTKPDGLVLNSKAYTTAQLDSPVSGTKTFDGTEGTFTVNSDNKTIFFDPAVSWHSAATIYYGQQTTVNSTPYYTYAKYVATPDTNLSFNESKLTKSGAWATETSTVTSVNNADSTAYGFDARYKTKSLYSDGTAYKVNVSKNTTGAWPTMTFDFWGTGVDIIGRCDATTGLITAKVMQYNTENVVIVNGKKMTAAINTYYKDGTYSALCQTPVVHFDGLPYAHYTVLITASYSAFFDKTGTQSFGDIELDGIDETEAAEERYSGPDLAKLLGDPDFAGVEVQSVMPDEPAFNVAGNAAGSGSYNVFVDGIRIYNPAGVNLSSSSGIGKTYADDNELNPTYTLMSTNIRTNTSAQAISLNGQIGSIYVEQGEEGSGLAAYNKAGPLNEVYLATNQTVAFKVASYSSSTKVHVALRNVSQTGAPKASINSGAALVINSNTEMYYDVSAQVTGQGIVTITNTGDGLLGIGNVKIIRSGASGQSTGDIELDGFEIELDSTEPAGAEIYVDAETLEYALSAAPTANSMPDAENVIFPVTFVKANGERVTASVTVPATKFNYSQKADGTWVAIANLKVSDALITKAMKDAGLEGYEASTEDGRVYLTARAKCGEWQAQAAEINVTLNKQERTNRWIDLLALIRQILTHLFSLILLK